MGKTKSVRFNPAQERALEDMIERGKASSETEAHRMLLNAGMQQFGYRVTGNGDTQLKWLAGELARLFSYIGVGWVVFFWAFPVQFAVPGVAVLFMALGMVAAYALLDAKEPAVSKRLGLVEVDDV